MLAVMVVAVWQRREPVLEAYTEERPPVQFAFDGLDFATGQRVDMGPSPLLVTAPSDTADVALPLLLGPPEVAGEGLPIGSVVFGGTVRDSLGPVPFATIRAEHHGVDPNGGSPVVSSIDVAADENGDWEVTGLGGGRWRVRAFVPEQLASTEPTVRFVAAGEAVRLDLAVAPPDAGLVLSVASPTSRELDEGATVAVSVGRRRIDTDGIVVIDPVPGASVEMVLGASPLRAVSALIAVTDAGGNARFGVVCSAVGSTQATFPVDAGVELFGSVRSALTTCVPPPPPPEPDPETGDASGQEPADG